MKQPAVDKIKNFALNLLFPKFCLGCQREGSYLCDDCKHLLEISQYSFCLCEKNPVKIFGNQANGKCSRCQDRKLSGLYFALSYKEKSLTRKLVRSFKYKPYLKELARPLAQVLAEHFILTNKNTNDVWENSVLIPVPLHIKKQKERGYNQSEELAKELSKIIKVPVLLNVLVKTKKTESQMTLKKAEREKNLQKAFTIKKCSSPELEHFLNKKIFLVDDVYTTGSTMSECAHVLKNAGAKQVWGICIAREG